MAESFGQQDVMQMRLNDTICMYKGQPVHVYSSAEYDHPMVTVCSEYFDGDGPIPLDNYIEVDYTSDDFDYYMPPIGYMNYNNLARARAQYIRRLPMRQYKQGLSPRYLKGSGLEPDGNVRMTSLLCSSGFRTMLLNQYPSVYEAIGLMEDQKAESVAISRVVAIGPQDDKFYKVYHKNIVVAGYNREHGYVRTFPSTKQTIIDRILMASGMEVL